MYVLIKIDISLMIPYPCHLVMMCRSWLNHSVLAFQPYLSP